MKTLKELVNDVDIAGSIYEAACDNVDEMSFGDDNDIYIAVLDRDLAYLDLLNAKAILDLAKKEKAEADLAAAANS